MVVLRWREPLNGNFGGHFSYYLRRNLKFHASLILVKPSCTWTLYYPPTRPHDSMSPSSPPRDSHAAAAVVAAAAATLIVAATALAATTASLAFLTSRRRRRLPRGGKGGRHRRRRRRRRATAAAGGRMRCADRVPRGIASRREDGTHTRGDEAAHPADGVRPDDDDDDDPTSRPLPLRRISVPSSRPTRSAWVRRDRGRSSRAGGDTSGSTCPSGASWAWNGAPTPG